MQNIKLDTLDQYVSASMNVGFSIDCVNPESMQYIEIREQNF